MGPAPVRWFKAIEQIRVKRLSLLLTDLELPNLKGLDINRKV